MAKSGILAKSEDLQESFDATTGQITIGIDLGDRFSHCCVLGPDGTVLTEGRVVSTPEGMLVISNNCHRPASRLKSGHIRDG
jgi:hypothetical protein